MYFSSENSSHNLTLYKSILDKYLENKSDDEVRKMFENIILTTHKVIAGELTESQVDHQIYNLVTSLTDEKKAHTREYFKKINPFQIGIEQFRTLSSILYSMITSENISYK